MIEKYVIGGIAAVIVFVIARAFLKHQQRFLEYQRELHKILNDERYKIKGKYDE